MSERDTNSYPNTHTLQTDEITNTHINTHTDTQTHTQAQTHRSITEKREKR